MEGSIDCLEELVYAHLYGVRLSIQRLYLGPCGLSLFAPLAEGSQVDLAGDSDGDSV